MSGLIDFLIANLKDSLFEPKDQFERVKRHAASRLLLPLIAIVGAESFVVAVLGALQTVEIRSGGFLFKLVASSSESFLLLALTVLIGFAVYVGSNVRTKYFESIKAKSTERASMIAALMAKRYPDYVDLDGEFLESLLTAIETPQLAEIRGTIGEVPRLTH